VKTIHDELGITKGQLKSMLYNKKKPKPKILKRYISEKTIKFGVVSDTHLCSNHEALDELHTFYEICRKSGITTVLHAGDVVSGWGIYHGQENEVKVFGTRNQADYVVDNYPKVKGIETVFITGNHDEAWLKRAGIDIGELIAEKRPDMKYVGFYDADVMLGGVKIKLHHGDGGGAYALSYKGQKFAEQIPSGEKPRVLIIGHYHTAFYFWYRNMHILNAGCFERQSMYLKRKMLNPAIGGWIIELRTTKKPNDVIACKTSWIPFF
jgi:predicted phosphodiesterase